MSRIQPMGKVRSFVKTKPGIIPFCSPIEQEIQEIQDLIKKCEKQRVNQFERIKPGFYIRFFVSSTLPVTGDNYFVAERIKVKGYTKNSKIFRGSKEYRRKYKATRATIIDQPIITYKNKQLTPLVRMLPIEDFYYNTDMCKYGISFKFNTDVKNLTLLLQKLPPLTCFFILQFLMKKKQVI